MVRMHITDRARAETATVKIHYGVLFMADVKEMIMNGQTALGIEFGSTNIKAVLTASNQFTAISNYYTKANKPNQSTINCCKRALAGEDNSNGAVYYYSPKICGTIAWFESMQCCLYLDSGIYSAKFFKHSDCFFSRQRL